MQKPLRLFFLAPLILFIFISGCKSSNIRRRVCIKDYCVKAEVVDNEVSRERGLMSRDRLGQDQGMLFIFEKSGICSIWMKNMLLPLDIIWISQERKIVYFTENAQPCSSDPCPVFTPLNPARYVLEVNSGFIKSHRLHIGEAFKF